MQIVLNPHRRHDEAHIARQLAAQPLDLVGEPLSRLAVDKAEQRIPKFQTDQVDGQRAADRFLGQRRRICGGGGSGAAGVEPFALQPRHGESAEARDAAQHGEGQERHARHDRQRQQHAGGQTEGAGIAAKLREQSLVGRTRSARLRHQKTGGDGNQQGGNLRHQAVADGQAHIGVGGLQNRHVVAERADGNAADGVDAGDHEARNRVAAHELSRAVHRAEKVALVLKLLAATPRLVLVDEAGGHIGVDSHLLAGHGVEGKTRRDFGDTARTLGDDDEIDDGENGEHDHADDEIAAHHHIGEGRHDLSRRVFALMAAHQHKARRAEIHRQAEQGGDEEDGGERAEFQRLVDEQDRHQNDDGKGDGNRQSEIHHDRRDRQHQHGEDNHQPRSQPNLAPSEQTVERASFGGGGLIGHDWAREA